MQSFAKPYVFAIPWTHAPVAAELGLRPQTALPQRLISPHGIDANAPDVLLNLCARAFYFFLLCYNLYFVTFAFTPKKLKSVQQSVAFPTQEGFRFRLVRTEHRNGRAVAAVKGNVQVTDHHIGILQVGQDMVQGPRLV